MTEPILLKEFPPEILEEKVKNIKCKCGVYMNEDGTETTMIGGCGELMLSLESYRCTDCTVQFHRNCAREHFKHP